MTMQRLNASFHAAVASVATVLLTVCLMHAPASQAAELPDFTRLVEKHAAAVVNISTTRERQTLQRSPRGGNNDELDEFFRRFLPPGSRGGVPFEAPRSLGSGFIIGADGYILTNNHVVEGADKVVVRLNDRRELFAEIVGADPRSDLALLKVEADDLPVVKIGSSESLKVGEWVLAIGSPFGFDHSVTAGIVSAKGRSLPTEQNETYVPFIQSDVAINPGNSGGPLFNLEGEVVGINSQIYSNSGGFMGVSFAIPVDVAMEVVEQLKSDGRVARGWLGVVIQEVNRDLAESFGLERPGGALVSGLQSGGPAESAGLQEGDVILEFNGKAIDRSDELPHFVGRTRPGAEATLKIVRAGKTREIKVRIGELPDLNGEVAGIGTSGRSTSPVGLSVDAVPDPLRERLGIEGGVRVTRAEGPAAAAGIRPGDVIVRLNNKEVEGLDSFHAIVSGLPAGKSVPVLINRNEGPVFLALRVPE